MRRLMIVLLSIGVLYSSISMASPEGKAGPPETEQTVKAVFQSYDVTVADFTANASWQTVDYEPAREHIITPAAEPQQRTQLKVVPEWYRSWEDVGWQSKSIDPTKILLIKPIWITSWHDVGWC